MALRPNPPRVLTVIAAVLLAIIGAIYAWPIDSVVSALTPVSDAARSIGLTLDRGFGFVCLFISPLLLIVGSLLPGI